MRTPHAMVGGLALALMVGAPATAIGSEDISATSGACGPRDAIGTEPSDARGSTFVGTYLGDSIAGSASPHDMLVSWSIERVYAGDPVPEDLFFVTPACAWTNLTPGVRYLFSTAVTELDGLSDTDGQPSILDSLAWELRPDGQALLAPFDTHAISDYASPELASISTFDEALAVVAPDATDGIEPGPALDPDFGCLASAFVAAPDEARGTTFVGTYIGDEALPGPGANDMRVYWSVEEIYAGGALPEVLTMRSEGCRPVTLEPGRRYLFSSSAPIAPAWANSLAWKIKTDGSVRLAAFDGTKPKDFYPESTRSIRSFEAALAAVAPGADVSETPERSGDRTPG